MVSVPQALAASAHKHLLSSACCFLEHFQAIMEDTLRRADPGDELTVVLLSPKLCADGGQMRMGEEW